MRKEKAATAATAATYSTQHEAHNTVKKHVIWNWMKIIKKSDQVVASQRLIKTLMKHNTQHATRSTQHTARNTPHLATRRMGVAQKQK
jgi:hypothetical protein